MAELGLLLAHVEKRPERLELGQVKAGDHSGSPTGVQRP